MTKIVEWHTLDIDLQRTVVDAVYLCPSNVPTEYHVSSSDVD